jgi:hypothetical protein
MYFRAFIFSILSALLFSPGAMGSYGNNYYSPFLNNAPDYSFIWYPGYSTIFPSFYQSGDSYFYSWPNSDQFADGVWVNAMNGNVPDKAFIYQDTNTSRLLYYCRAEFHYQVYYGVLIPDRGCTIGDSAYNDQVTLSSYQVLVRY